MNKPQKDNLVTFRCGTNVENLKDSINSHIKFSLFKDKSSASNLDLYKAIALAVRDRLVEKWIKTQQSYYQDGTKRVYYFSIEYLVGRALQNYLLNLDFEEECRSALKEMGHSLEEMEELDIEAGLGNGGLGRLAVCFLDSLATMEIPALGYGIRYEFGIFRQEIKDGFQQETADCWLRQGNPWEIPRPNRVYPIKFYGRVEHKIHPDGEETYKWVDTHDDVTAMAYDIPVPGYKNETVNNLRLWGARSSNELEFKFFNNGDYFEAVRQNQETKTISRVLYPNDNRIQGKQLRLKQEYFFVSASLQDIIRRFKKTNLKFDRFGDQIAIQLNDTHPALAIPELMRILVDEEGLAWNMAWKITVETMAYTNHTIMPEALEMWPVDLLGNILPRHLQIIYEINRKFLDLVRLRFPNDLDRINRMSIIEEKPEKSVRMAHLSIVGSHTINGVAALHSEILKNRLFKDFYEMFPNHFQNKTNGISQRHWLKECNPELAKFISGHIGPGWITDLYELEKLLPFRERDDFCRNWEQIKRNNKVSLARFIALTLGIQVNADSLFDVQIKRIHEYKRQLLNILHVVTRYQRIKNDPQGDFLPRTVIFSGKASPGYQNALLIVKLINSVAQKVNQDPDIGDNLKVIFLPNYSVSLAQEIIPAADLSQQISTAGMEASGTGNMKLALNGALTLGTLDGANVEILEEVGEDHFYLFGLKAEEVAAMKGDGYRPHEIYQENGDLKQTLDMVRDGYFTPENPTLFHPLIDSLLNYGDPYMVMADFAVYDRCHQMVEKDFRDRELWVKKSITNSAKMGKFSSDRTIGEYAKEIWNVRPFSESA